MPRSIEPIDWESVRLRYETSPETVAAIAASIGVWQPDLSSMARRCGWRMRRPTKKVLSPRSAPLGNALQHVREMLQSRMGAGGSGSGTLKLEREIRLARSLLAALEKVLDLEQRRDVQEGTSLNARDRLDDAQRDELARRIEGLRVGQQEAEPPAGDPRSESGSGRLAPVGEGGSASA